MNRNIIDEIYLQNKSFRYQTIISMKIYYTQRCWYCNSNLRNIDDNRLVYLGKVRWCCISCKKVEMNNSSEIFNIPWYFPPFTILSNEVKNWYHKHKNSICNELYYNTDMSIYYDGLVASIKISFLENTRSCLNCCRLLDQNGVKLDILNKYIIGNCCNEVCSNSLIMDARNHIEPYYNVSYKLPIHNRININDQQKCSEIIFRNINNSVTNIQEYSSDGVVLSVNHFNYNFF